MENIFKREPGAHDHLQPQLLPFELRTVRPLALIPGTRCMDTGELDQAKDETE